MMSSSQDEVENEIKKYNKRFSFKKMIHLRGSKKVTSDTKEIQEDAMERNKKLPINCTAILEDEKSTNGIKIEDIRTLKVQVDDYSGVEVDFNKGYPGDETPNLERRDDDKISSRTVVGIDTRDTENQIEVVKIQVEDKSGVEDGFNKNYSEDETPNLVQRGENRMSSRTVVGIDTRDTENQSEVVKVQVEDDSDIEVNFSKDCSEDKTPNLLQRDDDRMTSKIVDGIDTRDTEGPDTLNIQIEDSSDIEVNFSKDYSEDETPNLLQRDDDRTSSRTVDDIDTRDTKDQIEEVKTIVEYREILSQTNFPSDEEVEVFLENEKYPEVLALPMPKQSPHPKVWIAKFKIENVYNSFRTNSEERTDFQYAVFSWILTNGTTFYAKHPTKRRFSLRKKSPKPSEMNFLPTEQDILNAGLKEFKRSIGTACRSFKTINKKEAVKSKNMLFSMLQISNRSKSRQMVEMPIELSPNESKDMELVNALVLYCSPQEKYLSTHSEESRTKDNSKPEGMHAIKEVKKEENGKLWESIESSSNKLVKKADVPLDKSVFTEDKIHEAIYSLITSIPTTGSYTAMSTDFFCGISDLWQTSRTESVIQSIIKSTDDSTGTKITKVDYPVKSAENEKNLKYTEKEETSSTKCDCIYFDALCLFMKSSIRQNIPADEDNIEISPYKLVSSTKKAKSQQNKIVKVKRNADPSVLSDQIALCDETSENKPTETIQKLDTSTNVTMKHATMSQSQIVAVSHCDGGRGLPEDKNATGKMKQVPNNESQKKVNESIEKKSLKEKEKLEDMDGLAMNSRIVKESSLNTCSQIDQNNDTNIIPEKEQMKLMASIDGIEEGLKTPAELEGKVLDKIKCAKVQKIPKQKISSARNETPSTGKQRKVSKKKQKQLNLKRRSRKRRNSLDYGLGTIYEAPEHVEQDKNVSPNVSSGEDEIANCKHRLVSGTISNNISYKGNQSDTNVRELDTKLTSVTLDLDPVDVAPIELFRKTRSTPESSTLLSQLYTSEFQETPIIHDIPVYIDQNSIHLSSSSWSTNSSCSIDSNSDEDDDEEENTQTDITINDETSNSPSSEAIDHLYESRDDEGDNDHYKFEDDDESNSHGSKRDNDDNMDNCKDNNNSLSYQTPIKEEADILQQEILVTLSEHEIEMPEELNPVQETKRFIKGKKKRSWSFIQRRQSQRRKQKQKKKEKIDLRCQD